MAKSEPKTAILIMDFINDIVNTDSAIAKAAACVKQGHVIKHANAVIEFGRKKKLPIIFVKVGFSPNYIECPDQPTSLFRQVPSFKAYQLGTWGTEFHPDLDYQKGDTVVTKHRISAFYATDLEAILRAQEINQLVLCGVSTDLVVQTTARDAHDRDYEVIVITDACAADDEQTSNNVFSLLGKVARLTTCQSFLLGN